MNTRFKYLFHYLLSWKLLYFITIIEINVSSANNNNCYARKGSNQNPQASKYIMKQNQWHLMQLSLLLTGVNNKTVM